MNFDGDDFEMRVREIVNINRSKFDIVTNEDGNTTTTAPLTVAPEERVARERWVRAARSQFRLLETRNFDVISAQIRCKFIP